MKVFFYLSQYMHVKQLKCIVEYEVAVLECSFIKHSQRIVNQNGFLHPWAGYYECNKFLDFLKLFEAIDMDGSFPTSCCM
jgi:hypothetical protein